MEQQQSSNATPPAANPQAPAAPAEATHIVVQPTMPSPQPKPRLSGSGPLASEPRPSWNGLLVSEPRPSGSPETSGLASAPGAESAPRPGPKPTAEQLREALKEVYDPEIPINVVDLGLIYKLEEHNGVVEIDMTLTSPHCPIGGQIAEQIAGLEAFG